jgi:translation initiation factor 1
MAGICPTCGLPKEICACEEIAREQQEIRITTAKRRYGKIVTIVEGINASDINIDDLARQLKTKCAAGGTVKDGKIELQGDHKKKVEAVLQELGP